jgi:hypothetical protein
MECGGLFTLSLEGSLPKGGLLALSLEGFTLSLEGPPLFRLLRDSIFCGTLQ